MANINDVSENLMNRHLLLLNHLVVAVIMEIVTAVAFCRGLSSELKLINLDRIPAMPEE